MNEEIRAISSSQNALVYQSKNSLNGFEWDKHLMIFSTSAPSIALTEISHKNPWKLK